MLGVSKTLENMGVGHNGLHGRRDNVCPFKRETGVEAGLPASIDLQHYDGAAISAMDGVA